MIASSSSAASPGRRRRSRAARRPTSRTRPIRQPSSPASSPSRAVLPWVSLVSSTNAPSRIEIEPVGGGRDAGVVGDDQQRLPRRAQAVEQAEHVQGRGAVEVAGRLVGEHDERLVAERARDRDPLALAAGERRRQMPGAVAEPDLFQQLRGPASGRARRAPGQQRGQLDVLRGGQLVHQVEGLEDEADRVAAKPRQRLLAQLVDPAPGEPDLAARRPFQAAEQVQQRRLAAAARPHHGERLARGDLQLDAVERAHDARRPGRIASPARACAGPARHAGATRWRPSSSLRRVPVLGAGLEPAQVGLQPQHDALEQQPGDRAVRLGQRGPLRGGQPGQQRRAAARPRAAPGRRAPPPRRRPASGGTRPARASASSCPPATPSPARARPRSARTPCGPGDRSGRPAPTSPGRPSRAASASRTPGPRSAPRPAGRAPAGAGRAAGSRATPPWPAARAGPPARPATGSRETALLDRHTHGFRHRHTSLTVI